MKSAELFVRALEAEGVERIFGVPGEENLDFLEAIGGSKIEFVLTRHEQSAGFMAATHGRLTGRPGVCLATLGPGATNLVTAAGYAQLGGMPVVMITGQKPIRSSDQAKFQILDVVGMMRPLTKRTDSLVSGAAIPARVREAFRLAQEERPGVVHLELPEDIAQEEVNAPLVPASFVRRPSCDEKALDETVNRLRSARSPLLVIGAAANRRRCCRALRTLVDQLGIPFITTQMGKGVVDERSDRHIGNAALSSGDFVHRAIEASDLILNVGHDVIEKPPFLMDSGSAEVIHIHFYPAEVDPVYFPQVELIGDIANSVDRLVEKISPPPNWDFDRFWVVRDALREHVARRAKDLSFPMTPERLVADVRSAMSSDGIVALDNGIYKIWFARNYPARSTNRVLLDNALASMGAGLPSAMAACMVEPEAEVVAICGDGGFMMNSQELETAVRLGIDLVVVILVDAAYGMIRWKQQAMGFEDQGLEFGNPDFVKYAEAYGARGHRPTTVDEFGSVFRECLASTGVDVIELAVDYSDNDRALNKEIRTESREL